MAGEPGLFAFHSAVILNGVLGRLCVSCPRIFLDSATIAAEFIWYKTHGSKPYWLLELNLPTALFFDHRNPRISLPVPS
jgi:hypothetical protein